MARIEILEASERWKLKPNCYVDVYELNEYGQCEWFESYQVFELDDDWLKYYQSIFDGAYDEEYLKT